MTADALAIRWESLVLALGALALAVWAFRSPYDSGARAPSEPLDLVALQVLRPGQPVEVVEVKNGCVVGRGRDCGIVFDDATVSKMHIRLHLDAGAATIEDLDSTNGTLLNGKRLEGMAALRQGDRIGLGSNQIVYLGAPLEGGA